MSITSLSFLETKELLAQSPYSPIEPAKLGSAFFYSSLGMKLTERLWLLVGLANAVLMIWIVQHTIRGTGLRMFGL